MEVSVKIKSRKLNYGVGINDADYVVSKTVYVDGKPKIAVCPFYRKWHDMLDRCYSEKDLAAHPSYRRCSVDEEWFLFSKFKKWMEKQYWEGKHLDKDLLSNSGVYSKDTCVFIDPKLNTFLSYENRKRGKYLVGASLHKRTGTFHARCHNPFTGREVSLKYHKTEESAHEAWRACKHEFACQLAESYMDERIKTALMTRYLKGGDYLKVLDND